MLLDSGIHVVRDGVQRLVITFLIEKEKATIPMSIVGSDDACDDEYMERFVGKNTATRRKRTVKMYKSKEYM